MYCREENNKKINHPTSATNFKRVIWIANFVVGIVALLYGCCLKILLFEKKKFMGTPQVFDRCDILRICFLYFPFIIVVYAVLN